MKFDLLKLEAERFSQIVAMAWGEPMIRNFENQV